MQRGESTSLRSNFGKTLRESLHSTQSISGRASILTYANKQYPSATDALHAYITDFDNKQSNSPYKRTVEDLLSPKSVLLQTVERSLATGVRDTDAEIQRHRVKKLIDESYHEILRADSEQHKAKQLIDSSKQLHRASSSDLSSLTPDRSLQPHPSLTSLSTDTLVLQASQSTYNHNLGFTSELQHPLGLSQTSRHMSPLQESYRANAIQLKSLQSSVGSGRSLGILKKSPERKRGYREVSFTSSTDSKSRHPVGLENPNDGSFQTKNRGTMTAAVTSPEHKATTVCCLSNQKTSFESRNGKHKSTDESILSGGRIAPSWVEDVDMSEASTFVPHPQKPVQNTLATSKFVRDKSNTSEISGYRNVPSWIQDISMSEIQNAGEDRSHVGRAPPSWINDLNGSKTSSDLPTARHLLFNSQNSTSSRNNKAEDHSLIGEKSLTPGLTHQDLRSTSTNKENNPPTYTSTSRPKIKSSAEIHRLVRNSVADRGFRKLLSSSAVTKRRISSDMLSMTTDDLILAPSTGRGLPASRSMEDLRVTLKQMDRSSAGNSDRGTGRINRSRFENSRRTTASPLERRRVWPRDSSQKPAPLLEDQSRLNISDLYLSPRKYASRRYEQDQSLRCSPISSSRIDEGICNSPRYSQYPSWTAGMQHTGRFTNPRGSSEVYEQRVIDRAEKILGSPLTRPLRSLQTHSPNTEDVLDGDRSWEKAVPPYKPLRAVYGEDGEEYRRTQIIDRFLDDCLNSNSTSPRLTTGDQPGPVEALKNMLFTIQSVAVANDLTEDDDERRTEEDNNTLKDDNELKVAGSSHVGLLTPSDLDSQSEGTIDMSEEEGSKSLKRAMKHLSRLKYLVQSDSEQTL